VKAKKVLRKLATLAVWCLVALGVAVAIWLGVIDPKKLKLKAELAAQNVKRETVDVLAAGPAGTSGDAKACAVACRGNLRRIESAKRALHSRGMFATGSVSLDAVSKEMRGIPKCPCGGTYALGSLEQLPSCSKASSSTTDPADDHILRSF